MTIIYNSFNLIKAKNTLMFFKDYRYKVNNLVVSSAPITKRHSCVSKNALDTIGSPH